MKKRKDSLIGYSIIIAIVFIIFIMVISNNQTSGPTLKPFFINLLPSKKIEKMPSYLTLDTVDEGYDIYVPRGRGYRYGPSIIYYEDGSMDAWFASNGNDVEWDWITYRHYDGQEWSSEEVVLRPTKKSKDHFSVCDPGAIYFNGYYYLGYTSTENDYNGGVENCGYVARSKNPNGPFEKWSGDGWGDNPEPIIVYDEEDSQWGAGEISFVVYDDSLYIYYSWISKQGDFTKLAIADLSENWPLTIEDKGIVITKISGQDSVDVVYNDEHHMFIALCVENRFMENSAISVFESNDGFSFYQVDTIKNIDSFSHNAGISKMCNGHVNINDDLYIGYAYSKGPLSIWGKWATKIKKVKLKLVP